MKKFIVKGLTDEDEEKYFLAFVNGMNAMLENNFQNTVNISNFSTDFSLLADETPIAILGNAFPELTFEK